LTILAPLIPAAKTLLAKSLDTLSPALKLTPKTLKMRMILKKTIWDLFEFGHGVEAYKSTSSSLMSMKSAILATPALLIK